MAKPETQSVESLEAVIGKLEQQRADLERRSKELANTRASLAYSALADGDEKSRAKLDKLNIEAATHSSEIAAVQAAIKTANERLAGARDHEAKAADRANARELKVVLDQFVQTARQLDEALADVATLGRNLHQIQERMRELGSPVPNGAQLDSLGYRWLLTACASTPWRRHFETLAPHERRSFSALIDIWRATNDKHLASHLGDEQTTNTTEAA
jgi:chromosome segregation ATPase